MLQRIRHIFWLVLGIAALAGAFTLYTRPDFLLQLSNQIWGCF